MVFVPKSYTSEGIPDLSFKTLKFCDSTTFRRQVFSGHWGFRDEDDEEL